MQNQNIAVYLYQQKQTTMKTSKTTHEITQLGNEFVVRVLFNDGYTNPMQLGRYYKTEAQAQKKLEKHLELCKSK